MTKSTEEVAAAIGIRQTKGVRHTITTPERAAFRTNRTARGKSQRG